MKHFIALFVLATLFIAGKAVYANVYNDCKANDRYNEVLNLFLIDPTTPFSDTTHDRLHSGIRAALWDKTINGNVQVYMMGPDNYSAKLIYRGCIPQKETVVTTEPAAASSPPKSLWRFFFPNPYKDEEKELNDTQSPALEYLAYMKKTVAAIESAIDKNTVDSKTTCLIHDFANILHDQVREERDINIFFFTDLLDTELSKMLKKKLPVSSFAEYGIKKGKEYKGMARLTPGGEINIYAWGVGRDESTPKATLTKDEVDKLKKFWDAFFHECYGSVKSPHIDFSMDFPPRLRH